MATSANPTTYDVQKRVLDAMPVRATAYDAYFKTPKGFYVRVSPSGTKIFALRFRGVIGGAGTATGKPKYRPLFIYACGELTLAQDANIAIDLRAILRRGDRPQDD